ncbi:hypothetical protein MASR2M15_07630 [Anaerolineales bacterium]
MESTRLIATRYIWTAFSAVMFFIVAGNVLSASFLQFGSIVVMLAITILCLVSTGVVWNWGNVAPEDLQTTYRQSTRQKAKRKDRLEAILSRMENEDVDDLLNELNKRLHPLSDNELDQLNEQEMHHLYDRLNDQKSSLRMKDLITEEGELRHLD